jgi:DNA polymerase elongation subunit (family B)
MEFLLRSGIHFASVDITNDKIKMRRTWGIEIPAACHIDLQGKFRLEHDKTSMANMAAAVIDEEYADMKTKFPKDQHKEWEKTPLDAINIEYAAIDAYVAYELYRKIGIVNYGQRHLVPPPVPHGSPAWGYSDQEDE